MLPILVLLPCATVTGVLSYVLTGRLASVFPRLGVFGLDVHKPDRPVRAEMGGVAVVIALVAGSLLLYEAADPVTSLFLAGLAAITLTALVGVLDDLVGVRQRYKPLLIAVASTPLALALAGRSTVEFPLIGPVSFGLLYPIAVVPLAVATSSNFSNMLAGFNGMESGVSVLAIGTLTALAALRGNLDAAFLGALMATAVVGFMRFNWYPSRIFPGDTGTLAFGASIAVVGLMGGLEFAAVAVSIPAALDFALKTMSRKPFAQRSLFGDSAVDSGGHLVPPAYPALTHAMMRASPLTERGLVSSVLVLEACYCLLAASITMLFL